MKYGFKVLHNYIVVIQRKFLGRLMFENFKIGKDDFELEKFKHVWSDLVSDWM
jgi:hypothetical protein